MKEILYIVLPCYEEEEVLHETAFQLLKKYDELIMEESINNESKILFVNDGSKDKTWEIILELHNKDKRISGISLSRNRGHQNAVLAGMLEAKKYADIVITMDVDLQDDINAINKMLQRYYEGNDIVYGVRSKREKDTFFKKFTAESFYKIMNIMGGELVFNHADYRLMSKRAIECLEKFSEVNLFLRGIVPMIGFKSDIVYYERQERFAGRSKYPLKKMISFAIEGITSLSVKPIRLISTLGLSIFLISIVMLIYSLIRYFMGKTIIGWSSLIISIWAIGGLILLALGVIGEYIGKIYLETKHRPRYIIKEIINDVERNE